MALANGLTSSSLDLAASTLSTFFSKSLGTASSNSSSAFRYMSLPTPESKLMRVYPLCFAFIQYSPLSTSPSTQPNDLITWFICPAMSALDEELKAFSMSLSVTLPLSFVLTMFLNKAHCPGFLVRSVLYCCNRSASKSRAGLAPAMTFFSTFFILLLISSVSSPKCFCRAVVMYPLNFSFV